MGGEMEGKYRTESPELSHSLPFIPQIDQSLRPSSVSQRLPTCTTCRALCQPYLSTTKLRPHLWPYAPVDTPLTLGPPHLSTSLLVTEKK